MRNLDEILAELESSSAYDAAYVKEASKNDKRMSGGNISKQDAEANVLGGDRTNLQPAGEHAEKYHTPGGIAKEMTSFKQGGGLAATEHYDEGANAPYNLEEKRMADAKKVGEKSLANADEVNKMKPAEKAAYLANCLLEELRQDTSKRPVEKRSYPQPLVPLKEDEKKFMRTLSFDKQAEFVEQRNVGIKKYLQGQALQKQAAAEQHRHANTLSDHEKGAYLAENTILKSALQKQAAFEEVGKGAFLADATVGFLYNEKKKEFNSDEAFLKGAALAESTLEKVAADLLAVRPVIQDLLAKGILTQDEKEALISYLSSAELLTPEVIQEAVGDVEQADLTAEAILKAIEGPQGANIVPEPAQPVHSPTLPPEQAPVDDILPGSAEPKDTDEKDALIIEAALNIVRERKKQAAKKSNNKDKECSDKPNDYPHGLTEPYSNSYQH